MVRSCKAIFGEVYVKNSSVEVVFGEVLVAPVYDNLNFVDLEP